jgi:hypothetical protein
MFPRKKNPKNNKQDQEGGEASRQDVVRCRDVIQIL